MNPLKQLYRECRSIARCQMQYLRRLDYILLYRHFCRKYPVEKNNILMLSDSREQLSGNLWFIDQELKKRGYTPSYLLKKNLKVKKTFSEKKDMAKRMAKAEFIMVDDFYPIIYPIRIRKGTRLIQVWHAMGAFKTVGFSRLGKPGGPDKRSITHRNYTDAIVSSEDIRKNYAEAFGIGIEKIHAVGVPRTDIFFDDAYEKKIKEQLYGKYPVLKGKKVILFAPTFRGNGQNSAYYPFDWLDFEKLRNAFSEEYVCILKLHPFVHNPVPEGLDPQFYLDLTSEREINDLLFLTDVLITDYSSVIFEASLRRIPTVFFVPDLEEYTASRDFYYPFEDYTFGPVVKNMDGLVDAIRSGACDEKKLNAFIHKFCSACDGHSTEKFVDQLIERK